MGDRCHLVKEYLDFVFSFGRDKLDNRRREINEKIQARE